MAYKLYKTRQFTNDETIEERKNKYEIKSNPLNAFLREECKNGNYEILFEDFYQNYIDFLLERGYRIQTKHEVGRLLNFEGIEKKRKNIQNEFGQLTTAHFLLGIMLKKLQNNKKQTEIGLNNTDNTNNTYI